MKKKVAVFPGSFDPITRGHEDIVLRAIPLFDEIIVALGVNTSKQTLFSAEQRMKWIEDTFAHLPTVRCIAFEGLTVNFCKEKEANYLLRGLRNGGDFEYERTIAHMNKALWNDLETVLLFTDQKFASLHSTVIRELIKNKGDVSQFVPKAVTITHTF